MYKRKGEGDVGAVVVWDYDTRTDLLSVSLSILVLGFGVLMRLAEQNR